MKKQTLLFMASAFVALLAGPQLNGQTPKENRLIVFSEVPRLMSVSDNAKWAVGYSAPIEGVCSLVNLYDGTFKHFEDPGEVRDVADDGTSVGTAYAIPVIWNQEGVLTNLPVLEGLTKGGATAITPDGKYIIGNIGNSEWKTSPVRWVRQDDGSYVVERLPMLEEDVWGKKPYMFSVEAMSSDGNMIAGRMICSQYKWFPVIWKDVEDKSILPVLFGLEFMLDENGEWNQANAEIKSFTMDDKYIMGAYGYGQFQVKPLLYNIEENQSETPTMMGELFCLQTNDGKLISASPAGLPFRSAFIEEPGKEGIPLEKYAEENYGIKMLEQLEMSGTPTGISADNKTIIGMSGDGTVGVSFGLQMGIDPTGIKDITGEQPIVYADSDGRIVVKATSEALVIVSDLSGKTLSSTLVSSDMLIPAEKGVYIVKVACSDHPSYVSKVVVK